RVARLRTRTDPAVVKLPPCARVSRNGPTEPAVFHRGAGAWRRHGGGRERAYSAHLARGRGKHQTRSPMLAAGWIEIEQVRQRGIARVERLIADLAQAPVVLNEPQDRSLAGGGVVHEVATCKRRDNQQRLARAESTPRLEGAG